MTEDQFLELDKLCFEWPDQTSPFDEQRAPISALQEELSAFLGLNLQMHDAQDATFTFELRHDVPSNSDNYRHECIVAFTFSNFGKLVSVWGDKQWAQDNQDMLIRSYEILEKRGYIFVNNKLLSHPYTGIHEQWIGKTWGDRFFDWI